jgi:hypothetical protein
MNKSWSGFLPQNEVIKLQWALMEGKWAAPEAGASHRESAAPELQRKPDDLDKFLSAAASLRSGRKR